LLSLFHSGKTADALGLRLMTPPKSLKHRLQGPDMGGRSRQTETIAIPGNQSRFAALSRAMTTTASRAAAPLLQPIPFHAAPIGCFRHSEAIS